MLQFNFKVQDEISSDFFISFGVSEVYLMSGAGAVDLGLHLLLS